MMCRNFILVLVGLLLSSTALKAQNLSNDSEKKARDLLREVIESRERAKMQTPAPVSQTPAPAVSPAPPMAVIPPTQKLPPIITKPETQNLAPTGLRSASKQPNYSELESLYLSGKITARQFQQFLQDHTQPTPSKSVSGRPLPPIYTKDQLPPAASSTPPVAAKPAEVTSVAPTPAPVPSELKPENTQPSTDQTTLSQLEKKMDELFRLKAAREQAASQAATNSVDAAKPKTKRERMDQLLKLYIAGKVTETEYKTRRDQLIAEPEAK